MLTRVQGMEVDEPPPQPPPVPQQQQGQPGQQVPEPPPPPEKIPFVVIPLIHELTTNSTQLAEKRAVGPRKRISKEIK